MKNTVHCEERGHRTNSLTHIINTFEIGKFINNIEKGTPTKEMSMVRS